ncbi:MAG: TlpA family protein disulfide reductase [Aigarchaeota archaeon]|nr:TlpA family protein disulfide reductase [Aigarchaeota archaeon]MDW8092141.1 TlpA disulfide reductase family protein [Nitrososphaerota archaeon]
MKKQNLRAILIVSLSLLAFLLGGLIGMVKEVNRTDERDLPSDVVSIIGSERGRVILIDVMNTNCPPCVKQVAELRKFIVSARADVAVYSLSLEFPGYGKDSEESLRRFAEENGVSWKIVIAQRPYEVISRLGIYGIPAIIVVNRSGQVVYTHVGILDAQSLSEITSLYT